MPLFLINVYQAVDTIKTSVVKKEPTFVLQVLFERNVSCWWLVSHLRTSVLLICLSQLIGFGQPNPSMANG